ncbi:hemolysin A isoform X3 [Salvia hispanica]|uniref:hemolysin A isoform X3 n=1 Tax=Salvia hispanica TaxID=49212 RepID=UPI0020092FFE|nr:hemolysin A isoform X3 [Salvia hispanica]
MIKMAVQQIVLKFAAAASVSGGRTLFTNFSSIDSSLSSVRLVNVPVHRFVRSFAASSSEKIKVPRKRRRLDEVCLERFQQYSRTFIQSWIIQGKVFVDGKVVNKCGAQISDKSVVDIQAEVPKYVCRAGHKLEAAIELLEIDVTGKVALDSGLSTGGFTDCLLQYGASFVYGVDVGYGQVAEKIRVHECVMPAVINLMKNDAMLVTLIKPQFEAHRSQVGGGGIVRDPLVHQEVLAKIINGVQGFGFQCQGWIDSPLKGADGNKEFLASFSRMEDADPPKADLAQLFRCVESQPAM